MIGRWKATATRADEPAESGFDSYEVRLGDLMRGERATLGKSLLDVQRELKIKASYISAIENGDAKAFDTPSFIAGYVRSYARYLGMDPDECFETFCRESGFRPTHGLAVQSKPDSEKRRVHTGDPLANPNASFVPRRASLFEGIEPGAVGSVAVLAALVGVLGYGGWAVLQQIQKVNFAPVEQSIGVMDELPALGGTDGPGGLAMTAGAPAHAAGAAPGGASPDGLDRLYRPEALDVPVLVARDGPIATLDPDKVGTLADAAAAPKVVTPAAPSADATNPPTTAALAVVPADGIRVFGPDAPEVAIFAVRPAWVRVRSADGAVILEKILDAGEKYVLPAMANPPVLRTGNAGSVYFAVNGTAYGPAGTGASVVKNITLAPDALKQKFAAADIGADKALADFVAVAQAGQ